jgi:putative DNA primase/helicase
MFATGNNLGLDNDITRRVLLSLMDAGVPHPERRIFKDNPYERILRDRGRYIAAALTVVLAYQQAGRPDLQRGIGDPFQEWNDNVRSALVWCGESDPVDTQIIGQERDIHGQRLRGLLRVVWDFYAGEERTAAQMIDDAKVDEGELLIAIMEYCGANKLDDLNAVGFGTKLRADADRREGDLKLTAGYDKHSSVNLWRVECRN